MTTETTLLPSEAVATPSKAPTSSIVLFGVTSFLSAFLLFQVQLIVSKNILPWFGGSAAVWTTSMLVFQIILLAGYLYSHVISVRLPLSSQMRVHLVLLAAAFVLVATLSVLWPSAVTPGADWKTSDRTNPAAGVAFIILVSSGLPFFVLSATGPLLQAWLGRVGVGSQTYRLYSVSNIGSLLGLVTFPFLYEPLLRLKLQGALWSVLFCVVAILCGICAWLASSGSAAFSCDEELRRASSGEKSRRGNYLLWFLLAACASSLLLATTNLLCQEIITVPLLWVVPLSIYLLTFILCFDHPRWYNRAVFHPLFAALLVITCVALLYEQSSPLLFALPLLLFSAGMVCHGELVRLKPHVSQLTKFYLSISAGGAAGGVFVAVIAPNVFTSFLEFQLSLGLTIALSLAVLIRDRTSWLFENRWWVSASLIGIVLGVPFSMSQWMPSLAKDLDAWRYYPLVSFLGAITILGSIVFQRRPNGGHERGFRFVHVVVAPIALLAGVLLYLTAKPNASQLVSVRSFYGVIRVNQNSGMKQMMHGLTVHGGQLDPPMARVPTLYYGPNSGIGAVLQNRRQSFTGAGLRIGVIGLGAGTLAAYGYQGDSICYYELNPDVARLAAGPKPQFTFVRDSYATVDVKMGDARLVLEQELAAGHNEKFDVLVLDAFNGDAIPVHLLTKEAFDLYWKHLNTATGVIAVHITSRHVNLVPVLLGAADYLKIPYLLTYNQGQGPVVSSLWFIMTPDPQMLNAAGLRRITIQYVGKVGPRLWTDDHSDIIRLLY